jgi:phospholipid N-methyltransferase
MPRMIQSADHSSHYRADYDYLKGSPHLRHSGLNAFLIDSIIKTFGPSEGSDKSVLEVGAGDGSLTKSLLAHGYRVVATEMSEASAERLASLFGGHDRFEVLYDPTGELSVIEGRRFDSLLFASVLHHIPDYLGIISLLVNSHLNAGGALVSVQDPLWYPRVPRRVRFATEAAFVSWRLTQGNLGQGLKTRLSRLGRGPGETTPGDLIEYHVVRNGVNERAIARLLSTRFQNVRIETYWSTQGSLQQSLGEAANIKNTFSVFASGFVG